MESSFKKAVFKEIWVRERAVLFLIMTALFFSGCSRDESFEFKDNGKKPILAEEQVLRLNLYTEPPTLDPGKSNDATSFHVLKMLFEGLTRIQPDGKVKPAAAKSIEISEDLKTFRFTLRDSVWTNGDPVVADDFEYAWKRILNPDFEAPYAYQLYVVKNAEAAKQGKVSLDEIGVEAIDEKTLLVTLEKPVPYFLDLVAFSAFYPVNRNTVSKHLGWADDAQDAYVSNGAFELSSWKHNNEIEVVKNQKYWDRDSVRLEKILMMMIGDESTELSMFENGELHWAGRPISRLPADAIPALRENGSLKSHPVAAVEWYKFNTARFPFNHKKMRKAFSYAINRKEIIEKLMPDGHIVATGIVPKMLTGERKPFFSDGDKEKAKALFSEVLDEVGITKEDLPSIVLSYNSNEAHHRLAQAIQQQWNETFGIQVSLEIFEWRVYISKLRNHDFQIARLGWAADFRDPINFLEVFKYKNDLLFGGNNDTQWENIGYIAFLDRSESIIDEKERLEVLHNAERLFINEMPVAPIYFMTDNYVKKANLRGTYLSGLGDVDFKWAYFEAEY